MFHVLFDSPASYEADQVLGNIQAIGKEMALHTGTVASFDIEPFTKFGEHATDSAFPHSESPVPVSLIPRHVLYKRQEPHKDREHFD